MNVALNYLKENQERLGLERFGAPDEFAFLQLTPRFRASSHVIFLLMKKTTGELALVVKIPRLPQLAHGIEHEARVLKLLNKQASEIRGTVPEVVAFEAYAGWPILVQTGLQGRLMDPKTVRSNRDLACRTVTDWLVRLHSAPAGEKLAPDDWFKNQVESPICFLREKFPLNAEEGKLLEKTWKIAQAVAPPAYFPVVEHSDLSHPNLIWIAEKEVGVVDWETAELAGLPVCDLYTFLNYVATSKVQGKAIQTYSKASSEAFFGTKAWAAEFVEIYARRLELPTPILHPLFVLTWLRIMVSQLQRVSGPQPDEAQPSTETVNWLRANRFYTLWKQSLAHPESFLAGLAGG